MKSTRRAIRRHHYKRKIKEYFRKFCPNNDDLINLYKLKGEENKIKEIKEWEKISAAIWATTHTTCSKYCCGNPRKYFNEKTMQEKKQQKKAIQMIKEFKNEKFN